MASDVILLQDVLTREEQQRIDTDCRAHRDTDALIALREFLADAFNLQLATDADIVQGFVADSSNLPGQAEAVCRPVDERQCAVILRACHAGGVLCTISGGKSNLTGSATPQGGVIVSLVNMLDPQVRIDEDGLTATAPVGMIVEDYRRRVAELTEGRLQFPVDPTSRGDATIGGAISCNASGFTPGEAGAMRHWVAGLEFLLPSGMKITANRGQYVSNGGRFILQHDGDRMELPVPVYVRPDIKNAGGPFSSADGRMDFVDYVIGSEGIFGLLTACTLKLARTPVAQVDLFFSLPGEEQAVQFYEYLAGTVKEGLGSLSALEYFGANCRKYMDHEERLFRGDDPVAVYLQASVDENSSPEDKAEEWYTRILEWDVGIDEDAVLLLDNERDRAVFMEARHSLPANSLEVVQHRGTYTIMTDALVPPSRFREFLEFTHGAIRSQGMEYLAFGHLGDCHLHFMILPTRQQLDAGARLYDSIIEKAAELGGVYSGEHGTGKRKRADFLKCHGREAVEMIRQCKAAIDPEFLLNRGNVIEWSGRSCTWIAWTQAV